MRHALAVVALLVAAVASVQAGPVSLDLKDAGVREFVDLVFKGILKRDYVLGPGIGPDVKITISVRGVESDKLHAMGVEVLKQHGIETVDADNLLRFGRAGLNVPAAARPWAAAQGSAAQGEATEAVAVEPDAVEVYRPQFRSVESLGEALKMTGVKLASGKQGSELVFSGSAARIAVALDLLKRLDRRAGILDVRAVVIEYSDSSEAQQSFSAVMNLLAGRIGVKLSAGPANANSISFRDGSVSAVLTAIAGDSRFKQLAEPRLRVVDGQKARVLVGSDFPVRGATTIDKAGNAIASIEYKQAGIILELTPHVFENSILLAVKQQVSSVALTTSSGIDSPSVNKREVETMVDLQSGELVALAGLDSTTDIDTSSGFSWLPAFMRSSNKTHGRTQIFLLLEVVRI